MITERKKSDNVVFLENERQQQPSEAIYPSVNYDNTTAQLIFRVRDLTASHFPDTLHQLFDALDDDLYKLAENSTNNNFQSTYFNAMRSLRVFRNGLEQSYLKALLANYDEFWRSGGRNVLVSSAQADHDDELSLVGEEELEENLATSSMIDKASSRFSRSLFALNKRFAAMLGQDDLVEKQNPLGPFAVANVFRQEMSAWDGEIVVRIVIYKLFDKHVVSQLETLYEELNQLLVTAGIMPDIHQAQGYRSAPATVSEQTQPPLSSSSVATQHEESSQEVPSIAEIWGYMQQMMSTRQIDAATFNPSISAAGHLPVLPKRSVVDELSAMQQQIYTAPVSSYSDIKLAQERLREELVDRFSSAHESNNQHRLGEKEQQTINVILMLFNQVLDDPNLPDTMRAILARLQIPVLKAAIEDDTFIENKSHPARELVNNLAKACVGWIDDGDRSETCLYGKVKAAVDRILNEYKDDISLFVEINNEFTQYMDQSARVAAAVERRVTQTLEGEDRIQASRRKIAELLEGYHIDQLPDVARRLLSDPWKKLLTITLLREGEESQAWKNALAVSDELVKSVTPGDSGASRDELLAIIPKLGNKLREGFAYISYNTADARKLLNELQTCHIEIIRSKRPRAGAAGMLKPAGAARSPEKAGVQEQKEREALVPPKASERVTIDDEHDRLVAAIGEGQWIRMEYKDKEVVGKLVWRSKFTGTMLFVDGQGKKVAQIKDKGLAVLFRAGKSAMLEDPETPIMDRAIGRMMKLFQGRAIPTEAKA